MAASFADDTETSYELIQCKNSISPSNGKADLSIPMEVEETSSMDDRAEIATIFSPLEDEVQPPLLLSDSAVRQGSNSAENKRTCDDNLMRKRLLPSGWPAYPSQIKDRKKHVATIVADVVPVFCVLPFIALEFAAIHYNGLAINNSTWQRYQNASQVVCKTSLC
jgi:hypothetical protein